MQIEDMKAYVYYVIRRYHRASRETIVSLEIAETIARFWVSVFFKCFPFMHI